MNWDEKHSHALSPPLDRNDHPPLPPHPRHRNCPLGREPWPQGSVGPFSQNLWLNLSSQAPKIVTIPSFDIRPALEHPSSEQAH